MSQQVMRYVVGLFPSGFESKLNPQLQQYGGAHLLRDQWDIEGTDGQKVAIIETPEGHSQDLLKWLENNAERVEIFDTENTARGVAQRMATGQETT